MSDSCKSVCPFFGLRERVVPDFLSDDSVMELELLCACETGSGSRYGFVWERYGYGRRSTLDREGSSGELNGSAPGDCKAAKAWPLLCATGALLL